MTFRPYQPPFHQWMGPYTPATGFTSGFRVLFVTNSFNGDELDDRNTQAARLTLEFDYSDDTLMRFTYEHTNADDNRLRAARQYCKSHPILGCSALDTGMEPVFSAGAYGHWVMYFQQQASGLDYTDARVNPSDDIRSVDLDYTPWHTATNTQALFEIEHQLTDDVKMDFSYLNKFLYTLHLHLELLQNTKVHQHLHEQ